MTSYLPLVAAVLSPEPRPGLQPEDVTPGVFGFLVTLAIVLATIGLIRSMTRKVRGVSVRADAGQSSDAPQVSDAAHVSDAASRHGGAPGSGASAEPVGSADQPDDGDPAGEGSTDGTRPVA